jgi:hypothetical protein
MPGTCTLFIGPAGVGKSTYATQNVAANVGTIPAAIYLFIGPDRIRVGALLTDFQGVMTGVPVYRGGIDPLLDQRGC